MYYLCFNSLFAREILRDKMSLEKTIICALMVVEVLGQFGSFIFIITLLGTEL